MPDHPLDRRTLLKALGAAGLTAALGPAPAAAQAAPLLTRRIPSTGEELPLVGLGSWGVFNVGSDPAGRDGATAVLRAFFGAGGRLVDCSPMYGSSQEVIGHALAALGMPPRLFSADKVWVSPGARGPEQIEASRRHWRVPRFDLLQVHNLLAWEAHLPALFAMKQAGRLRYVGITTSHGRRHEDIERLMRAHTLDFIQVTYNIEDREVEARILPLAAERGIGVIVNRPFQRADLLRRFAGKPLPTWAGELDCAGWPEFLLKFIVSHPAVTCAIPATSNPAHALEDLRAARGRLPDATQRRRMVDDVATL